MSAAVAGVQLASRKQFSPLPFFQGVPSEARQLSPPVLACANTISGAAKAAEANSAATLLSFFMILLSGG
jgi:hypothetical protein